MEAAFPVMIAEEAASLHKPQLPIIPHPRRTEHHEIFRGIHPLERQELTHLAFIEGRLEEKIILVQGLVKREMGHLGMRDDVAVLAGGHLRLEEIDEVLRIRPLFGRRLLGSSCRQAAHLGQFEAFTESL